MRACVLLDVLVQDGLTMVGSHDAARRFLHEFHRLSRGRGLIIAGTSNIRLEGGELRVSLQHPERDDESVLVRCRPHEIVVDTAYSRLYFRETRKPEWPIGGNSPAHAAALFLLDLLLGRISIRVVRRRLGWQISTERDDCVIDRDFAVVPTVSRLPPPRTITPNFPHHEDGLEFGC